MTSLTSMVSWSRSLSFGALCAVGTLCAAGAVGALGACSSSSDRTASPDAGSGSPPDGASGATCGGLSPTSRVCAANEYCDYASDTCGAADGSGTCRPRPENCPLVSRPVCGCDGKTYAGECLAYMSGTDRDADGGCPITKGGFACGYTQCDLATQYCLHDPASTTGEPFSCVDLPACTGSPDCTCLAGQRCGTACAGTAAAGLTLTCS
jgi:hypothetical protein